MKVTWTHWNIKPVKSKKTGKVIGSERADCDVLEGELNTQKEWTAFLKVVKVSKPIKGVKGR